MTKNEIMQFCEEYDIKNCIINDDLSIDVIGNVFLYNLKTTTIPVKFNEVSGYFSCANKSLTSFKNCPKSIGRDFGFWISDFYSSKRHQILDIYIGGGFYSGNLWKF